MFRAYALIEYIPFNFFEYCGYANMTWVVQESQIPEIDGKQTRRLFLDEEIELPLVFHMSCRNPRPLSASPKKVYPPRPLDDTPCILVEGEPREGNPPYDGTRIVDDGLFGTDVDQATLGEQSGIRGNGKTRGEWDLNVAQWPLFHHPEEDVAFIII